MKKCWCKTSCLGYPQDLPIHCSWFQDGDLLWLQCHTWCIVWLQCFNTGKKLNVKSSLDLSLHLWVQLNIRWIIVLDDYRKESSFNLGTAETKLLYTLHWILSDAADECSLQAEEEGKLDISTFSYLFPLSAITVITLQQHLIIRFWIKFGDLTKNNVSKLKPSSFNFRHSSIYLLRFVTPFVSRTSVKIFGLRMENKFGRPFGNIVIQMQKDLLHL